MKSSRISLGGIPFLQKYFIAALIFANVSHLPLLKVLYISNQACFSHSKCPSITDKDFNSMNLTEAYRAKNILITPRNTEQKFENCTFGEASS